MTTVSRRYGDPAPLPRDMTEREEAELRGPVVLMVSGGADSTALLLLAATSTLDIGDGRGVARIARERLHVLHVNHGLRGLDAQEDEEFVEELARMWGIPCTVERVDVPHLVSVTPGGSFEGIARDVRYEIATRLANELSEEFGTPRGAARIVTAHTADDRAETFFMNAIRGTGPQGLASIPRRRNRIVRPLLDRTHAELCDLLRMHGIVWREDATNSDTRYLRNFVRHEVLPKAKERNGQVVSAISQTADILSDEDSYLTGIAAKTLRTLERRREDGVVVIDGAKLAATDVAVARRVIRQAILSVAPAARLEMRHVTAVLEIVGKGKGSVTTPMGVDISMEYDHLIIRARHAQTMVRPGWLPVPGIYELGGGRRLTAALAEASAGEDIAGAARAYGLEFDGMGAMLDAAACGIGPKGGRLWVSAPEKGEVLCPLGMGGQSKRLSDLLAEARIPSRERDAVPVIHTGVSERIVWVGGVRIDDRARCTAQTRSLLLLSLHTEDRLP